MRENIHKKLTCFTTHYTSQPKQHDTPMHAYSRYRHGLIVILIYFFYFVYKNINGLPGRNKNGAARIFFCWTPPLTYFWILWDLVWVAFGLFFMLVGSVFRSFFCRFLDAQNQTTLSLLFVSLHKMEFLTTWITNETFFLIKVDLTSPRWLTICTHCWPIIFPIYN